MGEFLTKFYIDKVLNLKEGLNNVFICKNIISESESFVDVLEKLHLKDNKDADEIFIISLDVYKRQIIKFIDGYFNLRAKISLSSEITADAITCLLYTSFCPFYCFL